MTLHNQGPDAYCPNIYGDNIVITRTIHAESSASPYKIQAGSKKGPTISSAKAELARICDHFNIAVENPINILSQDNARQFIQVTSPREKYSLFLKGTLLQQLTEDYDRLNACILEVDKSMQSQFSSLKQLKIDFSKAQNQWKEVQASLTKETEVEDLKKRLAWAHVLETEQKLEKAAEQVAEEEATKEAAEREIAKLDHVLEETEEQIVELEIAVNAEADEDQRVQDEMNQIDAKVKENKRILMDIQVNFLLYRFIQKGLNHLWLPGRAATTTAGYSKSAKDCRRV